MGIAGQTAEWLRVGSCERSGPMTLATSLPEPPRLREPGQLLGLGLCSRCVCVSLPVPPSQLTHFSCPCRVQACVKGAPPSGSPQGAVMGTK